MANVSEAKGTYTFLFKEDNIDALKYLLELFYKELSVVEYFTDLYLEDVIKEGSVMGKEVQIDIEKLKDQIYNTENLCAVEFSFTGAGKWCYASNLDYILDWLFENENSKQSQEFFKLNKSDIQIKVEYEDFEPGSEILGAGSSYIVIGKSFSESHEMNDFIDYEFTKENYEELGFLDWEYVMGEE